MPKSRARLKDIADATGFSANTVSLALRDSPRIPEETRAAIRAEARRLNYLPNSVAQSLVSRRTRTVGLLLTDITNPILTQAARALERELADRGYSLMLAASDNVLEKEIRALDVFRARQVDGILVYPTSHRRLDHIRPLRDADHPLILLVADPDAGMDVVTVDDRRGAYKATRHLLDLGHRRIGFLDAAHPLGNREKLEGYLAALAEAGMAADPALIVDPGGHGATEGHRALAGMMQAGLRPSALFATNDSLAIGAMRWCVENRLRIPQDLAIVGYDDTEIAAFSAVPITTVHYAVDAVARLAVERLMILIGSPDRLPQPEVRLIDPELVIRDSTRPRQGRGPAAP
ncbi:LacI family DNA-binding transcriptional regulator [Inquilinus sp. CA228]|uniref:LacI family DNA-binding transcriptional regulator n=1 Tax=Inquilinus sp. CA228 TaxID=3455609 RepID=UPI003F8D5C58